MALNQTHPEYDEYYPQWTTIRDAHKGQAWVKSAYTRCYEASTNPRSQLIRNYLPPTSGMCDKHGNLDPKKLKDYNDYVLRAEFKGKMAVAVRTAIGILWNKEATIELTPRTEYLREKATANNESLSNLMQRINVEQLQPGRVGCLVDLPTGERLGVPQPYISLYKAEAILNWDAGARLSNPYSKLNLVILDESEPERGPDFVYSQVQKYRVLSLGPVQSNEQYGNYRWGQFREEQFAEENMQEAFIFSAPIDFIPFYFINTSHCLPCIEAPISINLAELCFSHYRNSADYEQLLHEQAQETLVFEGGEDGKEYKIGSKAALFPAQGCEAYFIGIEGKGAPELRAAMQNKIVEMDQLAGQMIDTRSLQRESGEALATRLAAQTADLAAIAKTCGEGVERMVKDIALLLGDDPKDVRIKPNTNFLNPELFAKTLVELMQAKNMGYPIPDEDLVRMAQERGIIKDDFDTVMSRLKGEPAPIMATGTITNNPSDKTPKQLTPPAPAGGASKMANPAGISARGKTRNPKSKSK